MKLIALPTPREPGVALSADELAVINTARIILWRLEHAISERVATRYDLNDYPVDREAIGRVRALSEHAEAALFELLNVIDSHGVQDIPHEELIIDYVDHSRDG